MRLPILYSFRRCPYAIRARMALAYAGIRYELREVSLKNKPQEMLDISPKGTTPVMQFFTGQDLIKQDFLVLKESLDIMNWALEQHDPLNWKNLPEQPLAIAQQLIDTNDRKFKHALDHYKYPNRFPEKSQKDYRQQAEEFLQVLELQLQSRSRTSEAHVFLVSDRQTLADIAIFPFVRQFAYVDIDWFLSSSYERLQQWLKWHETSEMFEFVMQKFPIWTSEQEAIVITP